MKKLLNKKRSILDEVETSYMEILQHSFVNGLYGFNSGVVIAFVSKFVNEPNSLNATILLIYYFIHKQIESKILNRNKYTTRLGKNLIFPIPSTLGFVTGAFLTTLL